jgi:flagellar biosynthesis/type III secretory pathway M-ring protein FliF/YscJ
VTSDSKKKTPVEQLKSDPKTALELGAIVAVVLGGGIFVILRKMRASKQKLIDVDMQAALPRPIEDEMQAHAQQDSFTPSIAGPSSGPIAALAPGRIEALTNQIRVTAHKDAEVCAGVLRGWLREGA